MFANMTRFAIEVPNEETNIYETVAVIDSLFDLMQFSIKHFATGKTGTIKLVTFRQDQSGVYYRDDFRVIDPVENDGKINVEASIEVVRQMVMNPVGIL